ncbi:MAG: helix-turn-helix transcriptional regulator [Tunicatimonas sp.]
MESKNILAERIRQQRILKGYSQEHLAESAGISVRTLQRIEGGQTEPRGHTLIALAQVLDVAIEDLMDFTKEENRGTLHAINLSALAYWAFPLGNILLPLIIWIINKDKVKGANRFGKRQVLIQVGWTALIFLSVIVFLFGPSVYRSAGIDSGLLATTLPIIVTALVYLLNTIYILLVSLMISKNKQVSFLGLRQ